MIESLLKELGLNEKQTLVYLSLLERGRSTPAQLAQITGINRSTIYAVSKELVEKGLIVEDLGDKLNHLIALPPENIINVIKKEEAALNKKKTVLDETLRELKGITRNTKYSIPKIHFVNEEDVDSFMRKQADVWSQSILKYDTIWWGFQDHWFVKEYQKWVDWYWQKAVPKGLTLRLLTNQHKYEQEMAARGYKNRLMKYWNGDGNFSATTWVCGDYLIMIVANQKPNYLVQIHDAKLADNMRELFKGIWEGIR